MSSTYIPGFSNASGSVTESAGSGLSSQQVNNLIATAIAPLSSAVSGFASSITTDALTVNGTASCGTNALTCGALAASSATVNSVPWSPSAVSYTAVYNYNIVGLSDVTSTAVAALPLVSGGSGMIMPISCQIYIDMTAAFSTGTFTNTLCMAWGSVGVAAAALKVIPFLSCSGTNLNTAYNQHTGQVEAYYFAPATPQSYIETDGISPGLLSSSDLYLGWNGAAAGGGTGTITVYLVYAIMA